MYILKCSEEGCVEYSHLAHPLFKHTHRAYSLLILGCESDTQESTVPLYVPESQMNGDNRLKAQQSQQLISHFFPMPVRN